MYLLDVLATSPTRGELTWVEVLDARRFTRERGPVPGHDVVGRVVEGRVVSSGSISEGAGSPKLKYRVGELVYGLIDFDRDGAMADRVVVWEGEVVRVPTRRKPGAVGEGESESESESDWLDVLSTIPLAGLTAWQALFEHGGIDEPVLDGRERQQAATGTDDSSTPRATASGTADPGLAVHERRILITGASGAVGLLAVQLGRRADSPRQKIHVTAVCSSTHEGEVRRLGADAVLCHDLGEGQLRDGIRKYGPFDLILDLTGPPLLNTILALYNAELLLKGEGVGIAFPGKTIISIALPFSHSIAEKCNMTEQLEHLVGGRYKFFIVRPDPTQQDKISHLLESNGLEGFVYKTFPLEMGRDAMEECEQRGRKELGKVVVRVS